MTLGQRDGAPFFHCHALWTEADGRASGGHILPEETIVAEPFEVDAFGLDGAVFTAEPDPETNFKLFGPVPSANAARMPTDDQPRLRAAAAAEPGFCRRAGDVLPRSAASCAPGCTAASARIIGARFTDGRSVEPFATELAVRSGLDRCTRRRHAGSQRSTSRWSIISAASPRAGWCAATIRC